MPDLLSRAAAAVLVLAGLATFASAAARGGEDLAAQHLQLVTAAMAAAMFLAALVPAWRLPVIAAGALGKSSFLAAWATAPAANVPAWLVASESGVLLLLLVAGWALLQRARVEARWDAALAGEP